jgi:hypothetical protein
LVCTSINVKKENALILMNISLSSLVYAVETTANVSRWSVGKKRMQSW